jgi:hypothetical protein
MVQGVDFSVGRVSINACHIYWIEINRFEKKAAVLDVDVLPDPRQTLHFQANFAKSQSLSRWHQTCDQRGEGLPK